jgi:hypothetical protein
MVTDNSKRFWYYRRNGEEKGPFPLMMIQRFILLGRLTMKDQVSADRQSWRAIANTPEIIPEELRQSEDSPEKQEHLRMLRMQQDERVRERRHSDRTVEDERREGTGRRSPEPQEVLEHREQIKRVLDARPRKPSRLLSVTTALLIFVGLIGGGAYLLHTAETRSESFPDCNKPAAPGINWSGCKLEGKSISGKDLSNARLDNGDFRQSDFHGSKLVGAQLAYANFSSADLRYTDLTTARLVGADLRRADLSNSRLDKADLSYANLAGAKLGGASLKETRLGKAIWFDGRVCAPGSIGVCR